jgi:hypothetical protein
MNLCWGNAARLHKVSLGSLYYRATVHETAPVRTIGHCAEPAVLPGWRLERTRLSSRLFPTQFQSHHSYILCQILTQPCFVELIAMQSMRDIHASRKLASIHGKHGVLGVDLACGV